MDITDEFVMAESDESVNDIAKKLQKLREESEHGTILVTQEKEVIGFITDDEIVNSIAAGKEISNMHASEIINTDFVEVLPDETLGDVMPIIQESYPNAIVVIDENRECVGYFSKNDYKDAMAEFGVYDKTREPKTDDDWRTKGIAMSALGKKIEALKCFEKSVEKSDDKEKSWSNLAKRLERLNRLKDSIMCYDKVLSINSKNEDALTKKGEIYSKEKTDNLAIQSYKMALDVNPDNVEALISLGTEQASVGEIDEAIKNLDRAVELKGDSPELWFRKGNVYDKGQMYEEALKCYNKATDLNEWYEEAWYNKGVAYTKLGNNDQAVQCLIKILRINPANESAKEALNSYKEKGAIELV